MALGVTLQLPTADRYSYNRDHLLNNNAILLGGRAAEEIALHHMTTGAGNDIERATTLARKMVTEWGMSDKLGPLAYGKKEEQIFLGREIAQHRDFSEHTAVEIDAEVKKIVIDNYERAKKLLQDRVDVLHSLTKALLEKETLDGPEIDAIVNNGQPSAA
jgi:cell division protease FtsH